MRLAPQQARVIATHEVSSLIANARLITKARIVRSFDLVWKTAIRVKTERNAWTEMGRMFTSATTVRPLTSVSTANTVSHHNFLMSDIARDIYRLR